MLNEKCIFLSRSTMQLVVLDERKHVYPLELRDFNLLQCLLTSQDFVATRKELLAAGWPGRIVSETSLNVAIMKLRKRTEKCSNILQIKTISGHGYRLKFTDGIRFIESKDEISQCLEDLEKQQSTVPQEAAVDSVSVSKENENFLIAESHSFNYKKILGVATGFIVVGILVYIAIG